MRPNHDARPDHDANPPADTTPARSSLAQPAASDADLSATVPAYQVEDIDVEEEPDAVP